MNSKSCGFGILTYQNGARYEGNFVNNVFQGIGTFISSTNVTYEGRFHAGNIKEGKFTTEDGATYEGTFNDKF